MSDQDQFSVSLDRTANSPVSEGVHVFTIASGEEAEGPKGPYWKFVLACQTPAEAGKQVFHIVSLTPQSRWRLELFLDAVNAPKTGNASISQFVGRSLRAQITHQDYEGRPQARVGEMWPVTSAPKNVPTSVQPQVTKTPAASASASVKKVVVPAAARKSPGLPADVVPSE